MAIYTPSIDVKRWYPDKSDITKWVYDIIKYLHDTPIPTEEVVAKAVDDYLAENPITGVYYSPDNPPPYPVTSVNGQTGAVTVDTSTMYSPSNPPPYPVTSVNGQTGAVTVDTSTMYSPDNPPPYPVTSVNGQTGAVTGLYSSSNQPPYPVTSVNGKTGAVTVAGFSVSSPRPIVITNSNTDNVTLTLSGYSQNTYKIIYIMYECHSSNKDTGVYLRTSDYQYLVSGFSDFDGAQYGDKFAGVVSFPASVDDSGVLYLTSSDADAQLYVASDGLYWWGVS